MKMKKITTMALAAALILSLTACGNNDSSTPSKPNNSTQGTSSVSGGNQQDGSSVNSKTQSEPVSDNAELASESDFEIKYNGINISITKYKGNGGNIKIPNKIDGIPVIIIDSEAFKECTQPLQA